jgi:hypothetical protein
MSVAPSGQEANAEGALATNEELPCFLKVIGLPNVHLQY